MKTLYLWIAVLLLTFTQAQAQTWQWTHPEANPDPNSQNYAHDVEVDSSGNAYVLGVYFDSLYLGGSFIAKGYGSYLAKYNPAGTLLWYKLITYPASNNSSGLDIYASDMVVNAQGIFITGKYYPTNPYDYDCNTGHFSGTYLHYQIGNLNFTSGYNDLGFFLTRFNSNGGVVWNKLGTYDVCSGSAGAGSFGSNPNITSDKNGNIMASFILGSNDLSSVSIGSDNIPIQSGYTMGQLVVAKYSGAGILKWSNYAGGYVDAYSGGTGYVEDCNSSVADNNGNIFFYGTAKDSTFFGSQLFRTSTPPSESGYYYDGTFIVKLSSNGVWQFAKELCNSSQNFYNDIGQPRANADFLAVDGSNNVYAMVNANWFYNSVAQIILGDTTGHTSYGSNFLVKMNNNGKLIWDKFFGVETYTYSRSISYYNNNLYINCSVVPVPYQGLMFSNLYVDLRGVNFQSFVARADLNGNFQWVTSVAGSYNVRAAGVKAYQDNIYTCGNYYPDITTLGNLNTKSSTAATSIFFGKLKDQYIRVDTVTPTSLIPGCTISIPFTATNLTFSATNKFIAELSDINGDFTSVTPIGNVTSTGSGTITATIPASLTYGSDYRIRIRSSDTLKTGYNYFAYADTGYRITLLCPVPSSGFTATNITGTSATLNWAAVGCASGYKVQYRKKGTTAWTTAPVITTNTPTMNLTGLTTNTIYQWRVATRCKNNGTFSFSAFSAIKQFTTTAAFAVNNSSADNISTQTQALSIIVYPNPANNIVTIIFNATKTGKYTIELTDVSGKVLQGRTGKITAGKNIIGLDVSKYAQGMYIINLTDNEHGTRILKLNKE